MNPLRAVLLDVDGTLVDTADLLIHSLRHTLQLHLGGNYPDDQLRDLLGRPLQQQMEHFCPGKASVMAQEFLRFYEKHKDEEKPFDEALALLPWMRSKGLRVCLVTSKTAGEMVVTGGRFPGLHDVDAVVTSDQTERVKPAADPAILALQKLGVPPHEAIMIGDSPYDIQCGHSAGTLTGAALWGPFPRAKLEPFHPNYWFASPEEVRQFLTSVVA